MLLDNAMGYVPGKIEEVCTISAAFERWRQARGRLLQLKTGYHAQKELDSQLGPYPVKLQHILEWQRLIVTEYRRWFQQVLIAFHQYYVEQGQTVTYLVHARWDVRDPDAVILDNMLYQPPVLFDDVYEVACLGKKVCLIMVFPKKNIYRMSPIPVDFVDRVEGCVVVPPNTGN